MKKGTKVTASEIVNSETAKLFNIDVNAVYTLTAKPFFYNGEFYIKTDKGEFPQVFFIELSANFELIKITEAFILLWEVGYEESDTAQSLAEFWQAYCKRNGLGEISADDLLYDLKKKRATTHKYKKGDAVHIDKKMFKSRVVIKKLSFDSEKLPIYQGEMPNGVLTWFNESDICAE